MKSGSSNRLSDLKQFPLVSKISNDIAQRILELFGNKALVVYLNQVQSPFFILGNWSREDYKEAIEFELGGTKIFFRFTLPSYEEERTTPLQKVAFGMYADIFLVIPNPAQEFLDGLGNKAQDKEFDVANKIYSIYKEILNVMTLHGRWLLKLRGILDPYYSGFDEMFKNDLVSMANVYWRIGEENFKKFSVEKKQPSEGKTNPTFQKHNILTKNKWQQLRNYFKSIPELSPNIIELVRIQSKVNWGEKRIPTVETAALMEVVIRNAVTNALAKQGVSKNKIKDANDEAGLSILLNMLTPLILKKKEVEKYKMYLDQLDALRKVRNKIMHENLHEKSIDWEVIKNGVNAAIEITLLLEPKSRSS